MLHPAFLALVKKDQPILVTGAGGFIGGALVAALIQAGYKKVRGVDIKPLHQWYVLLDQAENYQLDLRLLDACHFAVRGQEIIFNLAADMGGMGFIEHNKAACMLSVLINTHMLQATRESGSAQRYFYASSACAYNVTKQQNTDVTALREEDAYPAQAEDGYGWEKLFSERMTRHFREDYGLHTTMARYHNVYGPYGTYDGGREKAPAAICRKVAAAKLSGQHEIEVWGDGLQTRSFMYIDDCIYGTTMIIASDFHEPINLGSSELISINHLVELVEEIAGITVTRKHLLDAPKGVRGRNSDNTLIQSTFGWEPSIPFRTGLAKTYAWIFDEMAAGRSAARYA